MMAAVTLGSFVEKLVRTVISKELEATQFLVLVVSCDEFEREVKGEK